MKKDSKPTTQTQTQTQTPNADTTTRPTFEQAKRDFETAFRAGEYTTQIQTLAVAVAVSVLRKCIDPQRKTAGTLDTVSNSGVSGALLDLRRGIFHDLHDLDRVDKAQGLTLNKMDKDGYIVPADLDPADADLFAVVASGTLSDGLDLVQTAVVALLEQATDHAGGDGWLDSPYTVRRPSRRVLIRSTDPVTYRDEDTTPIQEVYRAVRRAIASSRAVQTDPRNGYTYLQVETEDGQDTVYLRTGKYADLGGYVRDGHDGHDGHALPGAPAGFAGGFNPYTADPQTVTDYNDIMDKLNLSRRQREILEYRMQGYGTRAIATRLGVTHQCVEITIARLRDKCAGLGFAPAGYTAQTQTDSPAQ